MSSRTWEDLPPLNCPRFSASLIVCSEDNVFCFGGVESNPEDPNRFDMLKSIERLKFSDPASEWETLSIKTHFKGSGMGALRLDNRSFIVFGGWSAKRQVSSEFIFWDKDEVFHKEEGPNLAQPDVFTTTGLCFKNLQTHQIVFIGSEFTHVFNTESETFSIFGES